MHFLMNDFNSSIIDTFFYHVDGYGHWQLIQPYYLMLLGGRK